MYRRSFLALGIAVGTAGCSVPFERKVSLRGVRVDTLSADDQSVDVRIKKDGEVVHESTVEHVPGFQETEQGHGTFGAEFVDCTWPPDDRGVFTVAARRVSDEKWEETTVADAGGEACHVVFVRLEQRLYFDWRPCEPHEGSDLLCDQRAE